jgi:Ferritin-like domain
MATTKASHQASHDSVDNPGSLSSFLTGLSSTGFSRRKFMTAAALVGASLAASQYFAGSTALGQTTQFTGGPTDGATQFADIPGRNQNEKVLNFALTLEILEADLYRQALNVASGLAITTPLNSIPSTYSLKVAGGGLTQKSTALGYLYLKEFAYVEAAHRDFLIAAITQGGGTPTSPNPGGYQFADAVQDNILSILANILPLEETGVRAYLGALPYLTDPTLATTAATIFSTEARHSAIISYSLDIDPGPRKQEGDLSVSTAQPAENTFEYYLKPLTVLQIASQFFA